MKTDRFLSLILNIIFWMAIPVAAQAGINSGFSSSAPLNGDVGTGAVVKITKVFVGPEATDPKLDIVVTNNNPTFAIGGVSFDIDLTNVPAGTFDSDPATVLQAESGFIIQGSYPAGTNVLRVVIASDPQQDPLPAVGPNDMKVIGRLNYTAPDVLCTETPVDIIDNTLEVSSLTSPAFLFDATDEDGAIQVGILGDANADGKVNILDIVEIILAIFSSMTDPSSVPDPESVKGKVLDTTGDGVLNIADVIGAINIFFGGPPVNTGSKPVAGVSSADLAAPILMEGRLMVPVMLDTRQLIAGAVATFRFDPTALEIGTPQLDSESYGLSIDSRITDDGFVHVVLYSLEIETGVADEDRPMLLIPVTPILDGAEAELTLVDIEVANRQAQMISLEMGTATQTITKEMLAPKTFALGTNYPNPFNPSTTIAYDVAEQAHITLVVYNLLGQEVIRLVDEIKPAGRYQVVWNARNTQNREVASGIYLYRLVSDTGFSEARRMTLLK